jgi:hypothetical protein
VTCRVPLEATCTSGVHFDIARGPLGAGAVVKNHSRNGTLVGGKELSVRDEGWVVFVRYAVPLISSCVLCGFAVVVFRFR